MNNKKEKIYSSWLLVLITILILISLIGLLPSNRIVNFFNNAFNGIGAGIMAGFVAVYVAIVQFRLDREERKKKNNIEFTNQVKINYYILLTYMNEFPSQLSEDNRFIILDQKPKDRDLSIFDEMKNELKIYEANFYDAANTFMKSWLQLNRDDVKVEVLKELSIIETKLHKLSSLLDPNFVKKGLADTQLLKEDIVNSMVKFSKEICGADKDYRLGEDLDKNRQILCKDILNYQKYQNADEDILSPILKNSDDLTSSDIWEYLKINKKLDNLKKIVKPYYNYTKKQHIYNAEGYEKNMIRELMKVWGLEHDRPYNQNSLIYYWREPTGVKIIHICNGIGRKKFQEEF